MVTISQLDNGEVLNIDNNDWNLGFSAFGNGAAGSSIILNEDAKHYIVNKPGRPGRSLKIRNVLDCLPKFTIERAVKGMLSETETKRLMRRLKIFNSQDHSHQAQAPIEIDVSNFRLTTQFNSKDIQLT